MFTIFAAQRHNSHYHSTSWRCGFRIYSLRRQSVSLLSVICSSTSASIMSGAGDEIEKKESGSLRLSSSSGEFTEDAPLLQREDGRSITASAHGSIGSRNTSVGSVASKVTDPIKSSAERAARTVGKYVRHTSDSVGSGLRRKKKKGSKATTDDHGSSEIDLSTSKLSDSGSPIREVKFVDEMKSRESDVAPPTNTNARERPVAKVVEVGPLMEVLLRDTTIQIIAALVIAAYPTWKDFQLILDNEIPLSVCLAWMLVAASLGQEYGRMKTARKASSRRESFAPIKDRVPHAPIATTPDDDEISRMSVPSVIDVPQEYSLVGRVSQRFPKFRLRFRSHHDRPKKAPVSRVWTTLGRSRSKRKAWEKRGYVPVSQPLMDQLLMDPNYQRKSLAVLVKEDREEYGVSDSTTEAPWLGTFEASRLDAASMGKEVVVPLFKLRGMDVFLTDEGAEDNMGSHPFLIENGLRDSPTWIVNIMTQWGNLMVYLELPSWIKDWDDIKEHDDDPQDVISFKRFVNGDDDYRNARLCIMPHIVEGPMPIRVLTPKGKELPVSRDPLLPVAWKKYQSARSKSGRILHPCLETELDCMSNKSMRGMAGIVRRYIHLLSLDIAAILVEPPGTPIEEVPKACISTWRFDKIDVSQCPQLPPRNEQEERMSEERLDLIRASRYAGVTPEQLKEIEGDLP